MKIKTRKIWPPKVSPNHKLRFRFAGWIDVGGKYRYLDPDGKVRTKAWKHGPPKNSEMMTQKEFERRYIIREDKRKPRRNPSTVFIKCLKKFAEHLDLLKDARHQSDEDYLFWIIHEITHAVSLNVPLVYGLPEMLDPITDKLQERSYNESVKNEILVLSAEAIIVKKLKLTDDMPNFEYYLERAMYAQFNYSAIHIPKEYDPEKLLKFYFNSEEAKVLANKVITKILMFCRNKVEYSM